MPILQLCTTIEINVAIITASLPPIYSFISYTISLLRTKIYGSQTSAPESINVPHTVAIVETRERRSPPGESVLISSPLPTYVPSTQESRRGRRTFRDGSGVLPSVDEEERGRPAS